VTRLTVHIEVLRLPAGGLADRDRLASALGTTLDAGAPRPALHGLTPLERAVVTSVSAAVQRATSPADGRVVRP
jgi:hypothetical protein